MSGCLLLLGAAGIGCGPSNAVPQPVDAGPVDATPVPDAPAIDASTCACPGTELFSREHLHDVWKLYLPYNNGRYRLIDCERESDIPIGGACMLYNFAEPTFLTGAARIGNPTFGFATWACYTSPNYFALDMAARCVRPIDRGEAVAEACGCPAYETPADRIFYVPQPVTALPMQITTAAIACPAGTALLGGTCQMDFYMPLVAEGPPPDNPQAWQCSWYNNFQVEILGEIAAICLHPPGPDALTGEPVAPETIEYVFQEATLPANSTFIATALCDRKDTLLTGGCQVDDVSADLIGVELKHIGPAPPHEYAPNIYQCGWGNKTAQTHKVHAMATCLKTAAPAAAE